MQGTTKVQTSELQDYLDSSDQFYQDFLGYSIERTGLLMRDSQEWAGFCDTRGLDCNSSGIYSLRDRTAVVPIEIETTPLSLFHEYFGHGLFCEQSLAGRKLVELERRLLEEEREHFRDRKFTLEDLQRFRSENQAFRDLDNFREQNLSKYELFAIWTEYLLSGKFDLGDMFGGKYDLLQKEDRDSVDSIIGFSERYGDLATFYASGLARRTTPERTRRLLRDIYGDDLDKARLVVLYGSRKEFSDIDIFFVSDDLPEIDEDWLDSRGYSIDEFEKRIGLFDVAVTDPLMTRELIFGDEGYFDAQRRKLRERPITKEAIQYNLNEALSQERLALECQDSSLKRSRGLSYAFTYKRNAELLRDGSKDGFMLKKRKLKGGEEKNAA